jgi:hypothetical protein
MQLLFSQGKAILSGKRLIKTDRDLRLVKYNFV